MRRLTTRKTYLKIESYVYICYETKYVPNCVTVRFLVFFLENKDEYEIDAVCFYCLLITDTKACCDRIPGPANPCFRMLARHHCHVYYVSYSSDLKI